MLLNPNKYSKFIYKLVSEIDKNQKISNIIIAGNILKNLSFKERKDILSKIKIDIILQPNNEEVLKLIIKSSFVLHLNYADPCPNFICEAISYSKPSILNEIGGAREIALNSSIIPENKTIIEGQRMPKINDCLKSINNMIINYDSYKRFAEKRARQININKYIKSHIKVIKNL